MKRKSRYLGRVHNTGLHKIFINPYFGIESKTPCTFHNALNHHSALKTGIVGDPPHRLFKGTSNEINTKLLFAGESGRHLAELRNMVTSPGGTSAEAIYQLEKGGLRTIISKAVWAAYQKSRLLGEMSSKQGLRSTSPLESPGIPTEGLEEQGE